MRKNCLAVVFLFLSITFFVVLVTQKMVAANDGDWKEFLGKWIGQLEDCFGTECYPYRTMAEIKRYGNGVVVIFQHGPSRSGGGRGKPFFGVACPDNVPIECPAIIRRDINGKVWLVFTPPGSRDLRLEVTKDGLRGELAGAREGNVNISLVRVSAL